MSAATAPARQSAAHAPAATDGATDLQSPSTEGAAICRRWTSKRINADEGSKLVLARYSHKSSSASHDDEPTGALDDTASVCSQTNSTHQ